MAPAMAMVWVEEGGDDGAVEEGLVRAVHDAHEPPPLRKQTIRTRDLLKDELQPERRRHNEEVNALRSFLEELLGALRPHRREILDEEDGEDEDAALRAQLLSLVMHVRHVLVVALRPGTGKLCRQVVLMHNGQLELDACHDKTNVRHHECRLGNVSLFAVQEVVDVVLGLRDHRAQGGSHRGTFGLLVQSFLLLWGAGIGFAGRWWRRRRRSGRRWWRRGFWLGLLSGGRSRLSSLNSAQSE
mmetsp:Transcript_25179/g.50475  ORF Transcript_25179/g.50475 Transcript_25179/m.50475 type:complete len:243 (-) Transcript_25179:69-797(-)